MKKNFIIAIIASIAVLTAIGPCYCQDKYAQIREGLTKTYPKVFVGEIRESPIAGIYEFDAGPNILYYYPKKNLLIFGEIWTKEGKSLTAERRDEIASGKIKDIPLDKALKIGKGPNKVIEFTDPDCPFCRKASTFFKGREDVTRYVFFMPLPSHRDAEQKIRLSLIHI